ncbi:MAG: RNB domain-containing ribonuclease, partial [Bacilli bacterium]|nr:RNB domain-containing ribonuclease [Bacilli bacterium]
DDGLSVRKSSNGNYILGVHIANPTALIKENNIIFEEAKKRTTSIYLSDRTIAMYPSYISKDLMSLQENQYNMALFFTSK